MKENLAKQGTFLSHGAAMTQKSNEIWANLGHFFKHGNEV